jgi:hypothetical protein
LAAILTIANRARDENGFSRNLRINELGINGLGINGLGINGLRINELGLAVILWIRKRRA